MTDGHGSAAVGESRWLQHDDDPVADVVALATRLVRIPSVTNCALERIDEVFRCGREIAGWLADSGLEVRFYDHGRYPAVVAGFPGSWLAPITLCGHFDVVEPQPDDRQFEVRVEGDRLWGRGAADMKTVVATYMVWMRNALRRGAPYPPLNLLLVGNEENGEVEAYGTPHVLADLEREKGWRPELMIVGERTGERGTELFGTVCPSSRGYARIRFTAFGPQGHTGTGALPGDLLDRLIEARSILTTIFQRHLTMASLDGWESTARFPFLSVGEAGVYNITAGHGVLGVELRPIPEDDLAACVQEIREVCTAMGLEVAVEMMEAGVTCPADNPHLVSLLASVEKTSGSAPAIARKRPGSSARFAPGGNAVVWGESGHGPHSPEEWHFIPSIGPYLDVLDELARRTLLAAGGGVDR